MVRHSHLGNHPICQYLSRCQAISPSPKGALRRRAGLKPLTITVCIFLSIVALATTAGVFVLVEPGTRGRLHHIATSSNLFLYRHALIGHLTEQEEQTLYRATCTRKCHSTDVIEEKPRTAVEWEWVVARMNAADRADMSPPEARSITRYLQRNFLSNVPTTLPESTMAFMKKHLWKSDFGEDDIYLDLIYIPRVHSALMPYLVAGRAGTADSQPALGPRFILYINTHQGTVPPWNLAEMATLRNGSGIELQANDWQVIYDDGQEHHRQGLLTFPAINIDDIAVIEVEINLPGIRKKHFLWDLPIPDFNPDQKDRTDA